MLTDYHTHLRPDDVDASAERFFTEENLQRYLEVAADRGIADLGFSEHVYRFREALEIWRHPFWESYAVDDLDAYCDFVQRMKAAGHGVKLGLEVDYIAGREEQIEALIDGRPWDYVIGSVHFISGRAVDHEGYDAWLRSDPDSVWSEYFRSFGAAAESGLFDILAHPDLVKVWGAERPLPAQEPRAFYELAMEQVERADIAVEVSTAGLRKPVGEIYPSPELLEMFLAAGKPVALSSDAHEPAQIGYTYEAAVQLLRDSGVNMIAVFNRRQRAEAELG
jgi:histidinol-phosphatase (PHP family)